MAANYISRYIAVLCVLGTLSFWAAPAHANVVPGTLDSAFNGGVPILISDSASAGAAGTKAAQNPITGDTLWIGRKGLSGTIGAYKPDGTPETSFGGSATGLASLSADALGFPGGTVSFLSLVIDNQGRAVVAGLAVASSGTSSALVVVRYTPDGILDTSFGTAHTGFVTATLGSSLILGYNISLGSNGTILVTGSASAPGGSDYELSLWRFLPDGQVDTTFNGNGFLQVTQINTPHLPHCFAALLVDNSVIAGCRYDAGTAWKITHIKVDGSVDTGYGTNGFVAGSNPNFLLAGMAATPTGGLVISEIDSSATPSPVIVRKFGADGTLDANFNGGAPLQIGTVPDAQILVPVALQPDGKIITAAGAGTELDVSRVSPNGALDVGFGSSGISAISFAGIGGTDYKVAAYDAALQGDGGIVICGGAESTSASTFSALVTRLVNDGFDLTPAALSFDNVTHAPLGQAIASNATGIGSIGIGTETTGISVALQVQNGQYSTTGDSGPFMGTATGANAAWLKSGDSLALQQMTPNTVSTDTTTHVVAGGFWAPNNYQEPLGTGTASDWTTSTDTPPTANDSTLSNTGGQASSGTLNADNPSGGSLTFSIVSQPIHGSLHLDDPATGSFTYTSDSGYTGSDHFTWKVDDGVADSNTAAVSINVTAPAAGGGTGGKSSGGGGGFGLLPLFLLTFLCLYALSHRSKVLSARSGTNGPNPDNPLFLINNLPSMAFFGRALNIKIMKKTSKNQADHSLTRQTSLPANSANRASSRSRPGTRGKHIRQMSGNEHLV